MTLEDFLEHVGTRRPLDTPEVYRFMDAMSDRARRITCEINGTYRSQEELRRLFEQLFGHPVDPTFKVFPPFYTDFGQNIRIGRNVFVNAGCHFQDQGGIFIGDGCLIGHSVVMATLDHGFRPADRQNLYHSPIVLGKGVWIGAHATILRGVTIGDHAVVAAGAVVTKDVPANTVAGGVPARPLRRIESD